MFDVIGKIIDTPATFDDEGNVIEEAVMKDGFHVNTQEPVPEWESHQVFPEKPLRVYSNGTAIHYRFTDYDHFIAERDRVFGVPETDEELDRTTGEGL